MTRIEYNALPTMASFHASTAAVRCIVGPVGSGKTSAAAWEICVWLPIYIARTYGIFDTRWAVVRNTYVELQDTTMVTVCDQWFPNGEKFESRNEYVLRWPAETAGTQEDLTVTLLFRSCDRPEDMKKFKSLEITGCWIDESIEVHEMIKLMLKNRMGRYPRAGDTPGYTDPETGRWRGFVPRFMIETTNPCSVDHPMYSQYRWSKGFEPWRSPINGPHPVKPPTPGHVGWWQTPGENEANLTPGYYEKLAAEYESTPEWIERMVIGRPGMTLLGKLVYKNFLASEHWSADTLDWAREISPLDGSQTGVPFYLGWDNSGNNPAAVVGQVVGPQKLEILREYWADKATNIVDFTTEVLQDMERRWPGHIVGGHYCDPAGFNKYSDATKVGEFTSNAELQQKVCGIHLIPSEQNLDVRIAAVDQLLAKRNGLRLDVSCNRLVNGFQGGYVRPEVYGVIGVFHDKPKKNQFSHVHDALQYLVAKLFHPKVPAEFHDQKRDDYEEAFRANQRRVERIGERFRIGQLDVNDGFEGGSNLGPDPRRNRNW